MRFPVEPWENRPSDDELDQREAAMEAKGDIERDDKSALDPRFIVTEKVMEELLLTPHVKR